MPAKRLVTRENILKAAFDLVRERGMDALSVRELALKLNCSTQPIYHSFAGMDSLKEEVIKEIYATYQRYVKAEAESGRYPEYKAMGMGYIRFAREEPKLYFYMFMRNREGKYGWEEKYFYEAAEVVMRNYGLERSAAEKLHLEIWLTVHGIASAIATGFLDLDENTVSDMLTDAYRGFMSVARK